MANVKELRGRIKSVSNIAQITRAMEMVASMKLRKVQASAQASRPYTEELRQLGARLGEAVGDDVDLPLFQRRDVTTTGVFLVSSDRGLCGGYNSNVLAKLHESLDRMIAAHPERKFKFFVYGRKGYTYLHRRGYDIERFFVEPPLDKMDFGAAKSASSALVEAFETKLVDEVRVVYTAFHSVARFVPTDFGFLPMSADELNADSAEGDDAGEAKGGHNALYLLEPDAKTLLERLVPKYLETVIYNAMLESLASEHASRRMAMKGATDAATDMGKQLKRVYNRARQEGITKELLDLVGGVSALA